MTEAYPPTLLPAHLSARNALNRRTLLRFAAVLAVIAMLAAAAPGVMTTALTLVIALWYLASTIDRNWLLVKGIRTSTILRVSDEEALAIPDDQLPVYTVLLPAYDEPMVNDLVDSLERLDYPADKLEILLLIEEDDIPTQLAAAAVTLPSVRVVVVPHSLPKTKPKACNYGMSLPDLRGEMVTIYDAEDIPEPLQLRRAVAAFRRQPPEVGCIQCRLGYFNEKQNLLTRWFAMEYDQWFGVVLPAVQRSGCVVPLGGTSNHMPTRIWREVGGWDEFNVTEDADLGVRLARNGYRTVILDSLTLEEANSDVVNWIRQRSRWYKGYLQVMLVHLRHPLALKREIGLKAALRLVNMTGGIPLANAFNLVFWLALLGWFAGRPAVISTMFPPVTYYASLLLFIVIAPMAIFIGLVVTQALGKPHLWWAALLVPLYWVLQSVAAVKAIYQLLFRPFFWEKTVHGLSQGPLPSTTSTPRISTQQDGDEYL